LAVLADKKMQFSILDQDQQFQDLLYQGDAYGLAEFLRNKWGSLWEMPEVAKDALATVYREMKEEKYSPQQVAGNVVDNIVKTLLKFVMKEGHAEKIANQMGEHTTNKMQGLLDDWLLN
jgi:hypothetical protein